MARHCISLMLILKKNEITLTCGTYERIKDAHKIWSESVKKYVQRRPVVSTVMNCRIPYRAGFFFGKRQLISNEKL